MKKRETDALNLAVPRHEPPPGLEDKIMAAVKRSSRVRRSPLMPLVAAAVVVLALGNVVQLAIPRSTMKPGLEVVMLDGGTQAPKAFGTIVLDPDDNHGILAVRDLPASSGKYELWLRKDGKSQSAGTFEVNDDGYGALLLMIPEGFRDFHEVRLTPAGTKQVIMTGHF